MWFQRFYVGIFGLFAVLSGYGQQLSSASEISLLTIDPGAELYSAFGHTAIRVKDPVVGIDRVYNYGTFDFIPGKEMDFYLNFIKGRLDYRLDTETYNHFDRVYHYYQRAYFAQVLELTLTQRQAIFDYLEVNFLPENRYYLYEFFYDNCATRVRDVFQDVLADSLQYHMPQQVGDETFRDLLWHFLEDRRWAGFGIDLGLGAVVDDPVTPWMRMFLPDLLAEEFRAAKVITASGIKPLVKEERDLYPGDFSVMSEPWFARPIFVFWLLALIWALISFRQWQRGRSGQGLDAFLFIVAGLSGLILLLLWTATIHTAPAQNYNLLWLLPSHLIAGLLLMGRRQPSWLMWYFRLSALLTLLPIIGWYWLPQQFNPAFLPLMLMLLGRSIWRGWTLHERT